MRLDREGEDTRREAGAQALALPVLGGGTRVIETIRWDLAQARHVDESRRLAELLAGALEGRVPCAGSRCRPAPLRVLGGPQHAGRAVRDGLPHQPAQEKRAATDDARAALVQAVYDAVNRFAGPAAPRPPAAGSPARRRR